jgi:CheY-like chemotaxis protein/HPt (histidine-containing phosphotransfer) domain-containing protein
MMAQTIPARVLVIDDDAMSRELLDALLEAEGYAVESADSGEAALALLGRGDRAPDLVLADVQMPGMTGAVLAGKLRRACGRSTLLLAMSGSQPPEKTTYRFDGFLLKPFKMAEIAAALSVGERRKTGAKRRAEREDRAGVREPAGAASESRANGQSRDELPGEPVSDTPVLNEKIYRQLAAAVPAKQLQEMYTMCVNDARARIATMRRLAEARDGAQFMREAHALKGGCGMLGATELHGMAAELESNGLEAAAPGEPKVNSLDDLTAACDRLERMLGSRVRGHKRS